MKTDPIIAVKDVEKSSKWYQFIFDVDSLHGGSEFEVLITKEKEVFLCLHKWGEHEHPTMMDSKNSPGNGLILYFRTENLDEIWQRVKEKEVPIEKEIHLSPNSHKREFSIRDVDGYYLTVTDYHSYLG